MVQFVMKIPDLTGEYRQILMSLITSRLPDAKVYLFGSRARSTQQPGSDIDIALETSEAIDPDILLSLYSEIDDSSIPVSVDFVDMKRASEELLNEIRATGVLWKN